MKQELSNDDKARKLKDYLQFYIGAEVRCNSGAIGKLEGVRKYHAIISSNIPVANGEYGFDEFKLCLYPLETFTVKEMKQVDKIVNQYRSDLAIEAIKGMAAATKHLLSKHFDLFGLIESSIAIAKNK